MAKLQMHIATVVEVENVNSQYVKDEKHEKDACYNGLRVRAKIDGENSKNSEIPWAYPLLPKTLQSIPKKGEGVLIINDGSKDGQRFYVGPLISQPQYFTYCDKSYGTSLMNTSQTKPLERLQENDNTRGAFPKPSDIAVIGRGQEDIILRNNTTDRRDKVTNSEVQIRSGIRMEASGSDNPNEIGNIVYNKKDPAYVQVKHKNGLSSSGNSIVNVVADNINLMSNQDEDVNGNIHDGENLVNDVKIDEVMKSLHQVPKGDVLVKLLKIIKGCILFHVHPFPGLPQAGDTVKHYIDDLQNFNFDDLLSQNVRVS